MTSSSAEFPAGFLWGASTAAHQVEGGNTNNDWWVWEHTEGTPAVESSGDAIDQFTRYDEDFALLASLGHNAHRIALEWSRIEPAPGEFSEQALAHYDRVLTSITAHGMTPVVTLHHFTLPQWFAAHGGWEAPDAVEVFARYVGRVGARLGRLMPWICTINEPQIVALIGYALGDHPPGVTDPARAAEVNRTLARAHRAAVTALRATCPRSRLGVALQLPLVEPIDDAPEAAALADLLRGELVDLHVDDLAAGGDTGDFVGLQYYTRVRVDPSAPSPLGEPPAGAETTQMGWEVYPDGFRQQLHAAARTGLPVLVTENGIATEDDEQRERYLASHLAALAQAMAEGVHVLGYLHWSAFDNFEWSHGYRPRFGLVGIDREDGLRRVVKPSAEAYARVCRSGRLDDLQQAQAVQ